MPVSQEVNPLVLDHLELLNEILQSTAKTRELTEACKRCGLDVEVAHNQNEAQCQICQKLKAEFFPNHP